MRDTAHTVGAGAASNRGRGSSRHVLLAFPFMLVCFMAFSPTLAKGAVVDYPKVALLRSLTNTTMSMCLRPVEGRPTFRLLLRMEVKPIGPGSHRVFMAGSVEVPKHLLQEGTGWSRLRYKYTSVEKNLVLKVWLNNTELPYTPTQDMYDGRYELHIVKMFMLGRMEVADGDDCLLPPTPPGTPLPEPTAPATIEKPSEPAAGSPEPPATTTPIAAVTSNTAASVIKGDTSAWLWVMGAAGPVPVLAILVAALGLLLLVTILAVVLWRRKASKRGATNAALKKNYDPFSGCGDPLMPPPPQGTNTEDTASNTQKARFSGKDTCYNPTYKPPPTPSPNYYND